MALKAWERIQFLVTKQIDISLRNRIRLEKPSQFILNDRFIYASLNLISYLLLIFLWVSRGIVLAKRESTHLKLFTQCKWGHKLKSICILIRYGNEVQHCIPDLDPSLHPFKNMGCVFCLIQLLILLCKISGASHHSGSRSCCKLWISHCLCLINKAFNKLGIYFRLKELIKCCLVDFIACFPHC